AEAIAAAATTPPVEAHVSRDGFEVHPAADGRVVEPAAIAEALAGPLATTDPADARLAVPAIEVEPVVTTEMATAAAEMAERAVGDLEVTVASGGEDGGEATFTIDEETIASWITFGPAGELPYTMQVDATAVAGVLDDLAGEID